MLASRIDGSVGLLGRNYPGYFPVGDTDALARLLRRLETSAEFLAHLHRAWRVAPLCFDPHAKTAWKKLIGEITPQSRSGRRRRTRKPTPSGRSIAAV